MDLGLKNKTALVLGATSGIGFAIAKELAQEGANVTIVSRNETHLAEAKNRLKPFSVNTLAIDLKNSEQITLGISELLKKSSIQILVNNVGGPKTGEPLQIPLEAWDEGYQSLLRSVVQCSQLVVPSMKKMGWGRILTVTSTSAKEFINGLPVSATFRAGLSAWTKGAAREVGRSGILVNNLLPGPTRTERIVELDHAKPGLLNSMLAQSAIGRLAEPEEIAKAAVFLLSEANRYITGTDVLVDGGYTSGY